MQKKKKIGNMKFCVTQKKKNLKRVIKLLKA